MLPLDTLYRRATVQPGTQIAAETVPYGFIYSGIPPQAVAGLVPDREINRVTIDRMHFSDRRPPNLHITAHDRSGHTHRLLAEYLGGEAPSYAANERKRLQKSRRRQLHVSDSHGIVAVDELGLVLRRPGLDTRLPGLRVLYDPIEAGIVVERLTGESSEPVHVSLVAHRQGKRAVLRIELPGARVYYARLSPGKNDSALNAFEQHQQLYRLVSSQSAFLIPRPIGFDKPSGIALYDRLQGKPMDLAFGLAANHCRQVAAAIHALQALPNFGVPAYSGRNEAALLQRFFTPVRLIFPELAKHLADPLDRVCRALSSAPAGKPVICHRDLHTGQIFIAKDHIGILDFDTVCLASPALDPGNLAAHIFLASLRGECDSNDLEAPIATALADVSTREFQLWRCSALLRLAMIYCFTSEHPAVVQALIKEVTRCSSL